jgi:radical SAM family RiPP maturation amino acid epimerase
MRQSGAEELSSMSSRYTPPTYTPDELHKLAHLKRFLECLWADPDFREGLEKRPGDWVDIARSRRAEIDPVETEAFWRDACRMEHEAQDATLTPLEGLWEQWIQARKHVAQHVRARTNEALPQRRFRAWHARQMARCHYELGIYDDSVPHSIVVFELTKGCSVRCWFCGFRAGQLRGVFRGTPENRRLWRDILSVCRDEFGDAAGNGFCYWATEPLDNPDYWDFLTDFHDVLGTIPTTTTAVPLRDLEMTQALVKRSGRDRPRTCRFSVRSVEVLRRLHELFSPEELLDVDLVLQNEESVIPLRNAGRYRDRGNDRSSEEACGNKPAVQGTIACVSGFLVNMVDKTIKLISPCLASDLWPEGYRVHWEAGFSTSEDFRSSVRQAIREAMPEGLNRDQTVAFGRSISYERLPKGFRLTLPFRSYALQGDSTILIVGDLVSRGNRTTVEIIKEATSRGCKMLQTTGTLQHLFEKGFIDDDPHSAV